VSATGSCGCCACLDGAGRHLAVVNRPGLSAIQYRRGTYATFLEAMVRRLPVAARALTTREPDDPALALLDAWAITGDVLTFYQERIATEGYLRTATERRSILELGRLVDYRLKPGVSASVHLAYTLDDDAKTVIPAGSKSQSIPARKDEQAQMFETSEDIEARGTWNALRPRMSRPQRITIDTIGFVKEQDTLRRVLVDNVLTIASFWIEGTNTQFQPRDPLLFVFDAGGQPYHAIRRIVRAVPDPEHDRTELQLEPVRPYYTKLYTSVLVELAASAGESTGGSANATALAAVAPPPKPRGTKRRVAAPPASATSGVGSLAPSLVSLQRQILLGTPRSALMTTFPGFQGTVREALSAEDKEPPRDDVRCALGKLADFLDPLIRSRGVPPASSFDLARSLADVRSAGSDSRVRLLTAFRPQLVTTLYGALANLCAGERPYEQLRGVFVLRRAANVFGYNAPAVLFENRPATSANVPPPPFPSPFTEHESVIHLDTPAEGVTTGSYVVTRNFSGTRVTTITEVETGPLTAYSISSKSTTLTLSDPWIAGSFDPMPEPGDDPNHVKTLTALIDNLAIIRTASVFVQSEELKVAQEPFTRPVGPAAGEDDPQGESETRVELDQLVDGLTAGHRIIVRGKRADTLGTHGVVAAELAMIDNVEQKTDAGPGGKPYSVLVLAPKGLAFRYERSSVEILGNVAAATHGESQFDLLGSGDASKPMQSFKLRHAPLTFVSAATVEGVRSTLAVRIDDVLWHETETLADAGPTDRVFVTKSGDDDKVSITFGDGRRGQRLFTGHDNVRAAYRNGIGPEGNVRASQVATAISRAAGVRDVINPIEASGGAARESRDDARRGIPVSLQAMGRVVSIGDFADFARTFAGITKATAAALSDGRRRFVHLTIGGTGDIDIDETSDLYRNLVAALRKYGDPYQPFVVRVRQKLVMTGSARVRVGSDYLWPLVAPKVREALLDTFSYDRRDFGQPVYAAEVIATIQSVPGVTYVDLDELAGIRWEDVVRDDSLSSTAAFGGFEPGVAIGAGSSPPAPAPTLCELSILPHYACVVKPANPGDDVQYAAAEIAYLPPELADLFILTEIKA
jgi:hypothetical protein